jgi:hypothetical protein
MFNGSSLNLARGFYHHSAKRQLHRRRSKPQAKLMFKEEADTSSSSAIISPSRFVSDAMALRQQAKVVAASSSAASELDFDSDESLPASVSRASVSRSVVSRPAPLVRMSERSESKSRQLRGLSAVDSLPSATLLRRTTYADALRITAPTPLTKAEDRAVASTREATTLRLQSYAHHEKLMPSVTSANANLRGVMMRCRRCGNVFAHTRKDSAARVREQERYTAMVRSRALAAAAVRPTCSKCGSDQVESLLQHLHVKNNARGSRRT